MSPCLELGLLGLDDGQRSRVVHPRRDISCRLLLLVLSVLVLSAVALPVAVRAVIDEFVAFGSAEAVQRQRTRQPDEADQWGFLDASAFVIGVLGRVGIGAVLRSLRRCVSADVRGRACRHLGDLRRRVGGEAVERGEELGDRRIGRRAVMTAVDVRSPRRSHEHQHVRPLDEGPVGPDRHLGFADLVAGHEAAPHRLIGGGHRRAVGVDRAPTLRGELVRLRQIVPVALVHPRRLGAVGRIGWSGQRVHEFVTCPAGPLLSERHARRARLGVRGQERLGRGRGVHAGEPVRR